MWALSPGVTNILPPEHEETTSSTADKSKDSKTEETEKRYNTRSTTESKTSQVIKIYNETRMCQGHQE
jgi:hypothetical protein